MIKNRYKLITFLLLFWVTALYAGVEIQTFDNAQQQQQYKKLIDELRCLVCQNQNLADSDAELAQDLRKKVADMIASNKTEDEIIEYMVARYGDFVLYRPPFKLQTLLLWLGPFLILVIAVLVLVKNIKAQQAKEKLTIRSEQADKARQILEQNEDNK